jgi:anaerobic magnesium-protoporphyrin IX monomethyl ester cyclase
MKRFSSINDIYICSEGYFSSQVKSNMNIALINCAKGNYEIAINKKMEFKPSFPPLGLLYLGKILELNNYVVEIIDGTGEPINDTRIDEIAGKYDVVGLTVYSQPQDKQYALEIAQKIKERNPKIKIIIGGPHISLLTEESLREFHADVAVRGPGETVIASIMESIQFNTPIKNLPGVCYKKNNKIVHNKGENAIESLDTLSFPARHLTEKYTYGHIMNTKFGKGKVTSILTSRGCPYQCRFCGIKAHIPHYQKRSVQNVIEEIDEIVSQGYETIAFSDDNLLADKKRIMKILDHIITKHYKLDLWVNEARADSGDEELYNQMRKAGVRIINFGLESGNQDVLDYYHKQLLLPDMVKTIELSHKMGFLTTGMFILGAPIETEQHLKRTIQFAASLPLDMVSFLVLRYVCGSDLWREAEQEGKISYSNDGHFIYADSSKKLGNLTSKEIINYTIKGYNRFYYNPMLWLRYLNRFLREKDPRWFKIGCKFLIHNLN